MHIATCQHCRTEFEVDDETIAFLQGRSHFKCPTCAKLLPVAMLPALPPQVSSPPPPVSLPDQSTVAKAVDSAPKVAAKTWRGVNRNLLILGSAVILTLGGIGIYLATRSSGDQSEVKQDITNEIIKNQYFTGLIESGRTDLETLKKIARIEAVGASFIGLSREGYAWDEARELAVKAGGEVLAVESATERDASWGDPSTARLVNILHNRFPEAEDRTIWVSQNSSRYPRVIFNPNVSPVSNPDQPRLVFIRWWPEL